MNIYIGFEPKERLAYDVAKFSILRRSSKTPLIRPIKLRALQKTIFTRPIEQKDGRLWCPVSQAPMATEFAITRFVVPLIQTYGVALFCDCDIVCLADIKELFALADPKYAVQVVKHKHESGPDTKMDGQAQVYYERKNWSSVVLWNCDHPSNRNLTQEVLNTWPGRDLHAFKWLKDDEIGELPAEWNQLVGIETGPCKIAHFTMGGPWLDGWKPAPTDSVWTDELAEMNKK